MRENSCPSYPKNFHIDVTALSSIVVRFSTFVFKKPNLDLINCSEFNQCSDFVFSLSCWKCSTSHALFLLPFESHVEPFEVGPYVSE